MSLQYWESVNNAPTSVQGAFVQIRKRCPLCGHSLAGTPHQWIGPYKEKGDLPLELRLDFSSTCSLRWCSDKITQLLAIVLLGRPAALEIPTQAAAEISGDILHKQSPGHLQKF